MKLASFTAVSHFLLCCIMLFSPDFNNPFVCGARPPLTCSGSAQGYMGMLVAHRYGHCSPLGQEKSDVISAQILLQDERRFRSISSLAPSKYVTDAQGKETYQLPIPDNSLGGGNYVVNLGFGTPIRDFYLTLDTGSYATWIKCKPCGGCGKPNAIFDPNSSSTFRKTNCNTSNCRTPFDYLDGSSVEGYWASDTLTISPSQPIQNFNFVCVDQTNQNETEDVSGLLAFGQGDNSLVSQTGTNVFCHCLPSENATGYLLFDSEARKRCRVENFTPLKPQKGSGRYMVNFVGISIGNKTFNIFATTSSSQGTMIDSGTVITRLPTAVYAQFRSVFKELMVEYRPVTRPRSETVLDTCYELKEYKYSTVKIPVVLHFENLNVSLDRSQVLWQEEKSSVYCLAFAGNKDDDNMVIIGNHQLQKLNVLYDIQSSKVGIGTGNCG